MQINTVLNLFLRGPTEGILTLGQATEKREHGHTAT